MIQCMDSDNLHRRLSKVSGQIKAIDRMIDEDIPCEDILAQISAAKSALNKVGQVVLEGHIRHCVVQAVQKGDAAVLQGALQTLLASPEGRRLFAQLGGMMGQR